MMSTHEILMSYREAKHKAKQISILADLNSCDQNQIKSVLINAGLLKQKEEKKK